MFGRGKAGIRTTVVVSADSVQDQMPKMETVLNASCFFSGTIQSDGGICINGVFEGNLCAAGNVVVAETATAIAEMQASNIIVFGSIKGDATANQVEIAKTGKLWGDVTIDTIVMHEGAYHEGRTTMARVTAPPSIELPRVVV